MNIYRKDILSIIALKLLGLTLIWWFFFSHPVEKQLGPSELTSHYMSTEQYTNTLKK